MRFRAWQPPSALHPTITVDGPLRFELVDMAPVPPVAAAPTTCPTPAAGPTTPAINAVEAESRRGRPLRGDRVHAGAGRHSDIREKQAANPPTWARQASWICAGGVPFCVDGTTRGESARHRRPAGRLSHGAGPAGAVRAPGWRRRRIRRIRRSGRQCPAVLAGVGRVCRRTGPPRSRGVARRGPQPGGQRRHHYIQLDTDGEAVPMATGAPCGARGISTRCRW